MPRRAVLLLAALLLAALLALPARAAQPVPPTGLVKMLAESMTGRAVMGAGVGYAGPNASYSPADLRRAESLIEKCQVIAAAASKGDDAIIPFQVGKAYALAPETREDVVTDFSRVSPFDSMSPPDIMGSALVSLTDGQIGSLATAQGLAVADLSPEARAALAYLFQPPVKLPDGSTREEALDWSRVRLRGTLRMTGATYAPGNAPVVTFARGRGDENGISPARRFPNDGPTLVVKPPALREVPNTFKPSDLQGKAYPQRLGVSGVMSVADVAAQIARVTGLRLTVMRAYREVPFFIGSREITCGEALDGLRLSLQGAWRRLGDGYVLAWDVRGMGALQQIVSEAANSPTVQKGRDLMMRVDHSTAWLALLAALPQDPADPLVLTPEQRSALFETGSAETRIPFAQMTPAQQRYLSGLTGKEDVWLFPHGASGAVRHTLTAEDIQGSYLWPDARVALAMKLPGADWAPIQDFGYGRMRPVWLDSLKGQKETEGKLAEALRRPPKPEEPEEAKPLSLPAATRGLMVPVLTPGLLTEVTRSMKRHGLNVLFYPALCDGYASFPSKAFPLDPKLKGQDGWAMAAASARAAGIRMVGYISVLAWRNPGEEHHWLAQRPEWVDVDIAGRRRLDWVAAHPGWNLLPATGILNDHDYARPQEPAVTEKLNTLLNELAGRTEASGVAFADWRPLDLASGAVNWDGPPALGFAVPERLAALHATGQDPVDDPPGEYVNEHTFTPAIFHTLGVSRRAVNPHTFTEPPPETDAWLTLANRLLARAKQARPGWETWLVDDPQPLLFLGRNGRPVPKADHVLAASTYLTSGKPELLLTAWPRAMKLPRWPDEEPIRGMLHITDANEFVPPKTVVLDYRAAPNEIEDALRLLPFAGAAPRATGM